MENLVARPPSWFLCALYLSYHSTAVEPSSGVADPLNLVEFLTFFHEELSTGKIAQFLRLAVEQKSFCYISALTNH